MFKPKQRDEEVSNEIDYDIEESENDYEREEPIQRKKETPSETKSKNQLTVQEVVDMIEGHISRAGQLLQLLK